jgi:uncharacterized protein YbjT (DUF2867 family)
MEQPKIILVIGATGAQGGSVARFLLKEGIFKVRCLTRDPFSEKALALQKAGAELVAGDLNDITSLSIAMRGVYGVFGVTGFSNQEEEEYQHGKNLIFAVVINRVNFFIYSSLPDMKKISKGAFDVPVFRVKHTLEQYARNLKPDTSFIYVSDYYEHFFSRSLPHKSHDGNYYLQLPQGDAKYATVSAADVGGVVSTMFHNPVEYKKRTVGIVGSDMHCADYSAALSRVLKKKILYKPVTPEEYAALGFADATVLADKHAFNAKHVPDRLLDLIESHGLNPGMQSFEAWLTDNQSAFHQALSAQEKMAG